MRLYERALNPEISQIIKELEARGIKTTDIFKAGAKEKVRFYKSVHWDSIGDYGRSEYYSKVARSMIKRIMIPSYFRKESLEAKGLYEAVVTAREMVQERDRDLMSCEAECVHGMRDDPEGVLAPILDSLNWARRLEEKALEMMEIYYEKFPKAKDEIERIEKRIEELIEYEIYKAGRKQAKEYSVEVIEDAAIIAARENGIETNLKTKMEIRDEMIREMTKDSIRQNKRRHPE